MLVLSRKLGQSLKVGDSVRITIVKIDNNSVRLGIDAPQDVSIQRQEIALQVPQPVTKKRKSSHRGGVIV